MGQGCLDQAQVQEAQADLDALVTLRAQSKLPDPVGSKGTTFADAIKAWFDAGCPNQSTPAVALTAKLSADDLADYAAAGFDGVAGKPIDVRELAQAIAPFMVGRPLPANDA